MTDMDRRNLIEAVQGAMEGEKQAAQFYRLAADQTTDPGGKSMFLELFRFEESHYDTLGGLLESIRTGAEPEDYQGASFDMPGPESPAGPIPTDELKTQIDALRTAIAAEKKARETYARLASEATDGRLRSLFSRLSDEENLHRKVLEDQFFSLSNEGHWTWGE